MDTKNLPFNDKRLIEAVTSAGRTVEMPAETVLIRQGQYIKSMPIVLSGAVNVHRQDGNGNEIFLYIIEPMQTCAVTLQCCKVNEPSRVFAKTLTRSVIMMVPIEYVTRWMNEFEEWKQYVFASYHERFNELLGTIDGIAFQNLDSRLLSYLDTQKQAAGTHTLKVTHQEIANDLGSSREVVSRLLKQLEKQGKVSLSRNKIELM